MQMSQTGTVATNDDVIATLLLHRAGAVLAVRARMGMPFSCNMHVLCRLDLPGHGILPSACMFAPDYVWLSVSSHKNVGLFINVSVELHMLLLLYIIPSTPPQCTF